MALAGLVAYEGGSSGEEDSDDSDRPSGNVVLPVLPVLPALPAPKNVSVISNIVEEDDEFLQKKETPTEKPPPKRAPVKITLPSLSSFQDEERPERRPRFERGGGGGDGRGLLGLLPQPKGYYLNKEPSKKKPSNLIPRVLNGPAPIRTVRPAPSKKRPDEDVSDESDGEGPSDFFSLDRKEEPPSTRALEKVDEEMAALRKNMEAKRLAAEAERNPAPQEERQEYQPETEPNRESFDIEQEALRKLCSNRERRKGEAVQFIDIDQKEILPDPREWLTKALTEAPTPQTASGRAGDGPKGASKRKHQITYLAHQAKANEQALQSQWAANKLSRKQTQSKYGF